MKLLMWLIIGYLGYKFWLQPKMLQGGGSPKNNTSNQRNNNNQNHSNHDDDDYVDYEEVDD